VARTAPGDGSGVSSATPPNPGASPLPARPSNRGTPAALEGGRRIGNELVEGKHVVADAQIVQPSDVPFQVRQPWWLVCTPPSARTSCATARRADIAPLPVGVGKSPWLSPGQHHMGFQIIGPGPPVGVANPTEILRGIDHCGRSQDIGHGSMEVAGLGVPHLLPDGAVVPTLSTRAPRFYVMVAEGRYHA
jgi:hypothetical protein